MKLTVALVVAATTLSTVACKKPDDQPAMPADTTKANAPAVPLDQGRTQADREITARVRRDVVADGNLGIKAKNVTIVTNAGTVILSGPVATPAERELVATYARKAPGVTAVDDRLEVVSN